MKLNKVLENIDVPNEEEIKELFEVLMSLIEEVRKQLLEKVEEYHSEVSPASLESLSSIESRLASAEKEIREKELPDIDELINGIYAELRRVEKAIPQVDFSPVFTKLKEVEGKIPQLPKPLTGNQIIEEINTASKLIKKERIEGWDEVDKRITAAAAPRSSFGVRTQMGSSFSFAGDGITTTFYLPKEPAGKGMFLFAHYQGQWLQQGVHYSLKGRTFNTAGGTSTFTPDTGTTIEGFLINF